MPDADPPPLDGRQFEIAVRRLAESLNHGADPSPYVGPGIDYAQSRPFVDGDDVRAIDWRLTARTRRWYVKEYESARRLPVVIVVDTSHSMRVASTRRSKFDVAVQLAGGLALAGLARASPVGLIGAGEDRLRQPPTTARAEILLWLHRLRTSPPGGGTRLAAALGEFMAMSDCRCLVLVLSDLHEAGAVTALRRLAIAHDCAVLRPIDPAEHGRLGGGLIDSAEAETGVRRAAHGASRWGDPLASGRELVAAGIDFLALPTDQPFAARVRRFLRERDRRGAVAR